MIICLSYFVILSLQTPFFCSACFYYWAYRPGLTAVVLTQWSPTQILNWPYQKYHSKYKIPNPNIWFQVGNTPPEKKYTTPYSRSRLFEGKLGYHQGSKRRLCTIRCICVLPTSGFGIGPADDGVAGGALIVHSHFYSCLLQLGWAQEEQHGFAL